MKSHLLRIITLMIIVALPMVAFAQNGIIMGKVTDAATGEPLIGANVMIEGTSLGAAVNFDGYFEVKSVPPGTYTLKTTFIGYETEKKEIQVTAGSRVIADFQMNSEIILGSAISVLADRAKPRETPVAYSNVRKQDMEMRLGSRDIPLVLNTTPSVYSTPGGGGAGDARLNVRGFNQRNIAIMINGVPVNDMENGWVYWSNWDGVADATSSIQLQRGLSAVNLATPSIGGTMNIITDPSKQQKGSFLRQEVGNDGFFKTTVGVNSGLIDNKFAFNALVVKKTGDGYVDATWTNAWAYYFGASWDINKNNRLELYALGAPQRHGQNLYKQNIATYSKDFAKDLDTYDPAALDAFVEKGFQFNQNWAPVSPNYVGKQNWNGQSDSRFSSTFMNTRENFYHKPQVNLNWFTKLNDDLNIYTVLYYSGGEGGGTGTAGKVYARDAYGQLGDDDYKYYYGPGPWSWDLNETIKMNQGPAGAYYVNKDSLYKEDGQSLGIFRNSRNNQWTIGAISKANYKVSEEINTTFGVDWRTAEIEHYREVRDLLGGRYFVKTADEFNPNQKVGLGDKIAYNFTNTVDWLGFFGQGEYKTAQLSAYAMAGYSMIKYSHTNHFTKDGAGKELFLESDWISGMQIKGGASYLVTPNINVFGNVGFVSKVPIFDNVISDYLATKADDPANEKFISFEAGVNFLGLLNNTLTSKLNFYHTTWDDRANSIGYTMQDGSEGIIFLEGMNAVHQGVELEAAYQPLSYFRLDAAASVGNWKLTDDVKGSYKDWESGDPKDESYSFYVKDLKVGDAPQTQFAVAGSIFPIPDFAGQVVFRYYADHYADWNPFDRTDPGDKTQSWKAPNYSVVDLHVYYNLPFSAGNSNFKLFAHVFNFLNAEYIQDAVDNSRYNGYDNDHDADDAEVYFGLPRTYNFGLQVIF